MSEMSPQQLAQALVGKGMSQTEISRRSGVSQPTIARILSGGHKDPRSSTVDALRRLYAEIQHAA